MKNAVTRFSLFAAVACNQSMYDSIYKSILVEALTSREDVTIAIQKRNASIENLRFLCNGQLSTFERPILRKPQQVPLADKTLSRL